MHKYPLIKEHIAPMTNDETCRSTPTPDCPSSYRLLLVMTNKIGVPKRKEKRAASALEIPNNNAADIVTPERLTPGTSARACANPTSKPSRQLMLSNDRS